jgi:rSAM/selenodomain-associated transferase 2
VLVTIVSPVLDEEEELPCRAREIERQEPPWEWIVADGGSTDRSTSVARRLGARVLEARRGRGPQLNAGAAQASGQALLFLHADTRLPEGALSAVRGALLDERVVGGHFTVRFGDGTTTDRLFEAYYALQDRVFRVFYGDSAIFVRANAFRRVGGFPDEPIFEDLGLVRRLRGAGTLVTLEPAVTTSSRRYRDHPVRTIARWAMLLAAHHAGVPPRKLASLYPAVRGHRTARR